MVVNDNIWLYVAFAAAGTVVAAAGLLMRHRFASRFEIPQWFGFAVSGVALGLGVGCGSMHTLGYRWSRNPGYDSQLSLVSGQMMAGMLGEPIPLPNLPALQPGDELPPIDVESWLNGSSDMRMSGDNRVLVVDVWAEW